MEPIAYHAGHVALFVRQRLIDTIGNDGWEYTDDGLESVPNVAGEKTFSVNPGKRITPWTPGQKDGYNRLGDLRTTIEVLMFRTASRSTRDGTAGIEDWSDIQDDTMRAVNLIEDPDHWQDQYGEMSSGGICYGGIAEILWQGYELIERPGMVGTAAQYQIHFQRYVES